jgi:uncharacterized protein (DUF885 family)
MLSVAYTTPCLAQASTADEVNALANAYMEGFKQRFPLHYEASGLPSAKRDSLRINTPAELDAWWAMVARTQSEADAIDAKAIQGRPEWFTLAILKQALVQERAKQTCRTHLWEIKTFAWQVLLGQFAELQTVGDARSRAQIIARYSSVPEFVNQEIENLREGLRLGFSAPRTAVRAVVQQMDSLLAQPLTQSTYFSPAERDVDESFKRAWTQVVNTKIQPALLRYRDFLRDEYLAKARTAPGIGANPDGALCYRAMLKANTSIDVDPTELYDRAAARVEQETIVALEAGRRHYGRAFADLNALAAAMKADPKEKFTSSEDVARFIATTIEHAKTTADRVIADPPLGQLELRAYPAETSATSPAGQYVPADDESGRAPVYYYRADHVNLTPARLEPVVLHETWPGHHLQEQVTRARVKSGAHPISRLVYVPGVSEGWATYVEGLARDLQLYQSDLGTVGSVMDSLTPALVAEIGMHVMGWSEERTLAYLRSKHPATPLERLQRYADLTVEEPGTAVPYAMGAMEIESMRDHAKRRLGPKFNLLTFHRLVMEDGALPFPELRAKLDAQMK